MRNLIDINQEDLLYLKHKWSAEIQDLEDQIMKVDKRLTGRLIKNEDNTEELETLAQRLENATGILESIQANNTIEPELVANQQQEVDTLQAEYDDTLTSINNINAREVQMNLMDMEELQRSIDARAEKIASIDSLLAA